MLEFDGTNTDQLDVTYRMRVASTSNNSCGSVDCDDRGQARWKWITETTTPSNAEKTFDYLRALTNDALELADEKAGTVRLSNSRILLARLPLWASLSKHA